MSSSNIDGKITKREETLAQVLKWLPIPLFLVVSLPAPILFLVLFLASSTTETAAVYFFLTMLSAALGVGAALLLVVGLMFYRKRWLLRLRERLAIDGITASEVKWFLPELTTAERKTLKQMQSRSPLLADAYCEILASRLMATRLINRTRRDLMLVERRLNQLSLLNVADTATLQKELREDKARLADARQQAQARLAETQARMQMIEAAASRDQSHGDTYAMLQRLTSAQSHLPLSIEIAQMERRALEEAEQETNQVS